MERLLIEVHGTVQGVGFRPHVYALATTLGLSGSARNRGTHLQIDVEGDAASIRHFVDSLSARPPARASVDRIVVHAVAPGFFTGFRIAPSAPTDDDDDDDRQIPPDIATCDDCVAELFDPRNRRYRYPFITCAVCGPRFTIVTGVPYDRARTTVARFRMCEACRREYDDPSNRRFHAQSIACAVCGPLLELHGPDGRHLRGEEAVAGAVSALRTGRIVAIKGLGGFHLACDATNETAVRALRTRKRRDAKPFAVMTAERDLAHLRCSAALWDTLASPARPVVLLDRALAKVPVADSVAPACPALGVMLPYTPLHHLIVSETASPLVMTSGNLADEPLAFEDADARDRLAGIADAFLTHDRPIHTRCDDSVVRWIHGGPSPIRRARGCAPVPLVVKEHTPDPVLAVGGHLKNTFCVFARDRAYMSSHVGDLSSAAAYAALCDGVDRMTRALGLRPAVVVHDLHPDYLSTRLADEYPAERRIAVQHHHAHVLSCAAEHGVTDAVIGVAFDGSGAGPDDTIWGGEFLLVEGSGHARLAHLAVVPLAGGEAAVREPWRLAAAHLAAAGHQRMLDAIAERIDARRFTPVQRMIAHRRAPLTSSVGRLFDAVASITGLRDRAQFEGQAAMELEAIAGGGHRRGYYYDLSIGERPWTIHAAPLVRAIADDVLQGVSRPAVAGAFHEATAAMIADVATRLAGSTGARHVALTGGVFQNARLTHLAASALEDAGLTVLVHRTVPCNDGGLALGQAIGAARFLQQASDRELPACV